MFYLKDQKQSDLYGGTWVLHIAITQRHYIEHKNSKSGIIYTNTIVWLKSGTYL